MEVDIKDCSIGDIGIYKKDDGINCMGMCIGYDKKKNPIFTICSSLNINQNINELKKWKNI
ncbi:MAG: hypothetical protein Q4F88_03635 [Eubacteriales bacterium]|nr:hypothetical protein [Eubacteriales bacterium]